MNVKNLLSGMESRAMDTQFQQDICALYFPKDYGDTEPDCKAGYEHLLPLLTDEQKMSLEQMEQAYVQRRNYASQYGFKCGLFGAFRQFFGCSNAKDGGFQDLVVDDLLTQPRMQRHHENFTNIVLCNELDRSIMDALSEENKEHMVSIVCAWQQRVYSAAFDGFYSGYRAAYDLMEDLMPLVKVENMDKILTMEYYMGYIKPYSEVERLRDMAA